jgi:hypothetical protein
MSELNVTIDTPHGPVTMPFLQAVKLAECIEGLKVQGKKPTWHPNECGCCFSVHEDTEHPEEGWVVGRDGGADWIPHRHN